MSETASGKTISFFAEIGVDATVADRPAVLVIDRFDRWSNPQDSMTVATFCQASHVA
jgi:hypothetical protein